MKWKWSKNMSEFFSSLLMFIAGGLVSALVTFFLTKRYFEKQLRENPPINEKMIRAMFMQMGRKPSEAQIKAVMRQMTK